MTMFSSWAESSGLFGFLAPRGDEEESSSRKTKGGEKQSRPSSKANRPDPKILEAQRLQQQQQVLQGQMARETQALAQNDFCPFQRCRYYHKGQDVWYERAYVAKVHYDDHPPYYTIRYARSKPKQPSSEIQSHDDPSNQRQSELSAVNVTADSSSDNNAAEPIEDEEEEEWIEKQTQRDRIEHVPWNEAATLNILKLHGKTK